jgi:hypothetical protein
MPPVEFVLHEVAVVADKNFLDRRHVRHKEAGPAGQIEPYDVSVVSRAAFQETERVAAEGKQVSKNGYARWSWRENAAKPRRKRSRPTNAILFGSRRGGRWFDEASFVHELNNTLKRSLEERSRQSSVPNRLPIFCEVLVSDQAADGLCIVCLAA